ncbi:caax amino protease family protein [Streptococcus pneumoniae]|nr:caax amino protease family protein [Streptococcus pneumoniae]
MKKRAIQILLALSLIFYKSTWFWRLPKFQVEVSHPKEIHLATCSPSIF